ncbi:hypothetical protein HD554DRAFT_2322831 [Boletus coccyginus]|nr:hypothetical protein HD554DRAFT_2322831 [Boletus coccyginus]
MSSGIALDNAAIMSTSLEAILYGFSVLMFIGTMWVLTREKARSAFNRTMIPAIAVLFLVLSTAHMIAGIVRLDGGLVKDANTFPGGPVAFFADVSEPTLVVKSAIYTLQTLLGDGVVIYRCYVVWQSLWSIVLPSILWCSVAVTGAGSVYSSLQPTNDTNVFAGETGQWIKAFYASTLTANLLSSGLLAYRIWTTERNVASVRVSAKSTMTPVLRIVIDAVLLYSATLFTALICFANANNGLYVVLDMTTPIISIAFYMVLIRVAMGQRNCSSGTGRGMTPVESRDSMRTLQVHVSQFSRSDSTPSHPIGNHEVEKGLGPSMHKVETYEV